VRRTTRARKGAEALWRRARFGGETTIGARLLIAFEDDRAADDGWPTMEAEAGAMLRFGHIADTALVANFCKAYAEASRKKA
jgi:hypothetical protein